MKSRKLHRIPRHPHAWFWCFAGSQALVAGIWWWLGWPFGLTALLASHAVFVWATLVPGSRLFSPVLTRLPGEDRVVWLTIDDGPSDDTAVMLDLLDEHQASATFFLVGERAAQRPQLVRDILARGHGIGNHSASHPQAWFWALSPARMEREIASTQAILREITGQSPRWFRAVVGMANPFVAAVLKRHGLARVAWSARGYDAVVADPQRVMGRLERGLKPGAVVLLHEGASHGRNVEVLALVLKGMDEIGLSGILPEQVEAGNLVKPPDVRSTQEVDA